MNTSIKVVIAEDHPVVCKGICDSLKDEGITVVGIAADIADAIRQINTQKPDVVIIDLCLRSGHGIDLIKEVKEIDQTIKCVVFSAHDEIYFAERALRAGAVAYVQKTEPVQTLITAIHRVMRGEIHLSPRMANRLLHAVVGGVVNDDPITSLSDRELEVFELIGQGQTTKQIAARLHLSHKTIETHREKIKVKLNLHTSKELDFQAIQWGLSTGL